MSNFRKRSKTVGSSPARQKLAHTSKSRPPLAFRKFADFLLRRKGRRKADQDPNSLVLEKQVWFHGKITAEYAERCLRREGDFLVREDPAKPGSCFLVVRYKNKTALHLPITKVKSSKGNRIKYKVEDSTESYDSISELINRHVKERSALTPKTGAIIMNVVSRDTTLLSDDVFTPSVSNEPFVRHIPPRSTFGTLRPTPLMPRVIERKNSDPVLSTRVLDLLKPDQRRINSGDDSGAKTMCSPSEPPTEPSLSVENDLLDLTLNPEDLYDKPENNCLVEDLYDKPKSLAEGFYDKPDRHLAEDTYDKPENNSLQEDLYDKPSKTPQRVPSLRYSDPPLPSQKPRSGSRLQSRASVPLLDSRTVDLHELEKPGEEDSEQKSAVQPHCDGSLPLLTKAPDANCSFGASESGKASESSEEPDDNPPDPPPKDRHGIYLDVMRKIRELLVEPFLQCDCLSLARHMTRMELEILWREDLGRKTWSLEDGSGGAEGLEMLTLPQGRTRRTNLIGRYTSVTHWVAALLVGAGDLSRRELVLTKLIELADVLSDKLGNLISFMAVMDGLALPQVSRLHHTWSCLHHQHSSTAILYHSTLMPLAGLLMSGAPSPFPGVCLPYIVPLARLLEMSTEEVLNDWARDDVDLGLETMMAHLDSGRSLTQQLDVFRREAVNRLQNNTEYKVDPKLESNFKNKFNVGDALGLAANPGERASKVLTLLHWLSEKAENSIRSPVEMK